MIDLRSDTVTQPTDAMRQVMAAAPVGDDVYGDDPSVNALQAEAAELFNKEAGLFVASGTQSNLLALLCHCGRGDEYIAGQNAHCYRYEGGGAAVLGGIQPQPLAMDARGQIDLGSVRAAIKPEDPHFARTRLLCLENTYQGAPVDPAYMAAARALCDEQGLALHLDGARVMNAVVAQQDTPAGLAAPFDTVSVCLSKGLGAPVGSVLLGPAALIEQARRWRKMLGGGMRQAGFLAAAGRHALARHCERLAVDHAHAEEVADALNSLAPDCAQAQTNMVHLNLPRPVLQTLQSTLLAHQVVVRGARWVFHLGVSRDQVDVLVQVLRDRLPDILRATPIPSEQ